MSQNNLGLSYMDGGDLTRCRGSPPPINRKLLNLTIKLNYSLHSIVSFCYGLFPQSTLYWLIFFSNRPSPWNVFLTQCVSIARVQYFDFFSSSLQTETGKFNKRKHCLHTEVKHSYYALHTLHVRLGLCKFFVVTTEEARWTTERTCENLTSRF